MGTQLPLLLMGRAPQFSTSVHCGQTAGWTKMPLGMQVGLSPSDFVFDGDPATPERRAHPHPILAHVYCGQTARWMKTPLGTEVDLSPGHIVIDVVPAVRERGTAAPPRFAHVYYGHGRPSQLLLSSCK